MQTFRMTITHNIRESITIDVRAADKEEVERRWDDIYIAAMVAPWETDHERYDAVKRVIEPESAEHFDTSAMAVITVELNGDITISDVQRKPDAGLRAKVESIIGSLHGYCLDEKDDIKKVIDALVEGLS